jgi:outer membrane cobalamin receptor
MRTLQFSLSPKKPLGPAELKVSVSSSLSIDWKASDKSLIGIGATHLSDHSWGGAPLDGYTVARIHGSYQLTDAVKLHARVENVFDQDYDLSSFFGTTIPGAGTGIYAGITMDW